MEVSTPHLYPFTVKGLHFVSFKNVSYETLIMRLCREGNADSLLLRGTLVLARLDRKMQSAMPPDDRCSILHQRSYKNCHFSSLSEQTKGFHRIILAERVKFSMLRFTVVRCGYFVWDKSDTALGN